MRPAVAARHYNLPICANVALVSMGLTSSFEGLIRESICDAILGHSRREHVRLKSS